LYTSATDNGKFKLPAKYAVGLTASNPNDYFIFDNFRIERILIPSMTIGFDMYYRLH